MTAPASSALPNPWRRRLAIAALWTAIGLFFSTQYYASYAVLRRDPIPWGWAVTIELIHWYIWGALAVPVLRLGRRYPVTGVGAARHALGHVLLAALIAAVQVAVMVTVLLAIKNLLYRDYGLNWQMYRDYFISRWHWGFTVYWVLLGLGHLMAFQRLALERERTAADLETRLAEARLQALRAQVNPHFLFNTLNAVSSLVYEDPQRAVRCVARLSDLLRASLDTESAQEIPLEREIGYLQNYLEIMRTRFGERLRAVVAVEPDTGAALVPGLVLQPLVENAVQHAVAPRPEGGAVAVRAALRGRFLELEVEDDGPGLPEGRPPTEGVGLSNLRSRLRHMYGTASEPAYTGGALGGLLVRIAIPFRTEPSSGGGGSAKS